MAALFKNNYNVEETDSEGLKPLFEEVAAHSATYHANKIQANQYALHNTVMLKKIQKLRQSGIFFLDFSQKQNFSFGSRKRRRSNAKRDF